MYPDSAGSRVLANGPPRDRCMVAQWLNPGPPPLCREWWLPPMLSCVCGSTCGFGSARNPGRLKHTVVCESARCPAAAAPASCLAVSHSASRRHSPSAVRFRTCAAYCLAAPLCLCLFLRCLLRVSVPAPSLTSPSAPSLSPAGPLPPLSVPSVYVVGTAARA